MSNQSNVTTNPVPSDVTGGPVAPVEPPKEAAKVEQKPSDQDVRFQQLARRERQIREQVKQYQAQKAQWEAEKAQLMQKLQTPDTSWKDRVKTDLVGALADAGLTYDEVINTYANHTPADQNIRILQGKLAEMEANQKKILDQYAQTQTNNYNQAVKQIRMEVKQLVKSSPEDFEVINSQGPVAEQAVVKLIEKTYEEEGYLMDVADAAKEVEEYLTEQSLQVTKLKKIQSAINKQAEEKITEQPKPEPQVKGPTTLSNTMTVSTKPATSKDRRERAILAFQGKLNQ